MTKSNSPEASEKKNPKHECGVGQGTHSAGKPVEPREGDGYHSGRKLPEADAVTTLPLLNPDKKAIECARKQNEMSDGQLAQVPSGRSHKSTTSSGN